MVYFNSEWPLLLVGCAIQNLIQFNIKDGSKKESLTPLRRRYFCCLSGAVGENLFELRRCFRFQLKVRASFLAARQAAKIAATKKTKQKVARQGSPFLVTFLAKQKSV
jgi:hypothetical protein